MKLVSTQLAYFFRDKQARRNVRALLKYVAFVVVVVVAFAEVFHLIMLYAEGVDHSWVTGLYWTLTVMSTLGFGDITFQSDIGRVFSIIVLISECVYEVGASRLASSRIIATWMNPTTLSTRCSKSRHSRRHL